VAGYSGTPPPKKLGIKAGHRVAVVDAPAGAVANLGELPEGVSIQNGMPRDGRFDVLIWFVSKRAGFERRLLTIRRGMPPAAAIWIAWPKKASGVATDMTENVIRAIALPTGLVDNKVCAIDETWSGLRLVLRVEHRS
jgi:hypothetical protein